jgi:hypothetical protein
MSHITYCPPVTIKEYARLIYGTQAFRQAFRAPVPRMNRLFRVNTETNQTPRTNHEGECVTHNKLLPLKLNSPRESDWPHLIKYLMNSVVDSNLVAAKEAVHPSHLPPPPPNCGNCGNCGRKCTHRWYLPPLSKSKSSGPPPVRGVTASNGAEYGKRVRAWKASSVRTAGQHASTPFEFKESSLIPPPPPNPSPIKLPRLEAGSARPFAESDLRF